jgi:excisionase family DNA binding protein
LEVIDISFRDVPGIADELGVDVQTVRRWIQSGRLRAFKPGKEYRVREGDLEEFLAAREVRPKAQAEPQRPSLDQVRDMFAPLADGLNRYCARWEEKLPSLQGTYEEVADFALDLQDFRAIFLRVLEDELYEIAVALDLGSRYAGESGLPRDTAVSSIRAQTEEHSFMHTALLRYRALAHALAESIENEEEAESMRHALTEVGV